MSKVSSLESKFRTEAGVNPVNPIAGDVYFNTVTNNFQRYDGAKYTGIHFGITTSTSVTTSTSITTTTSTSITTTSSSTSTTTSTSTSTSTTTTL